MSDFAVRGIPDIGHLAPSLAHPQRLPWASPHLPIPPLQVPAMPRSMQAMPDLMPHRPTGPMSPEEQYRVNDARIQLGGPYVHEDAGAIIGQKQKAAAEISENGIPLGSLRGFDISALPFLPWPGRFGEAYYDDYKQLLPPAPELLSSEGRPPAVEDQFNK